METFGVALYFVFILTNIIHSFNSDPFWDSSIFVISQKAPLIYGQLGREQFQQKITKLVI